MQPGHQHIEAHIIFHRASRTRQTASTTLKHSTEEAARFMVDGLWDCPKRRKFSFLLRTRSSQQAIFEIRRLVSH